MSASPDHQAVFDALSAAGLVTWQDAKVFKGEPQQVVRGSVEQVISAVLSLFAEDANLDPQPWVHYYEPENRSAWNDLPGSLRSFRPRPEYEQDRDKYPIGQRF